jgi:hypothetical protein
MFERQFRYDRAPLERGTTLSRYYCLHPGFHHGIKRSAQFLA